jgi:2-haloacid dehalogenase
MEKPKAVLFDAYGTLFDVYSVGLLAEQLFPGHGQALSVLWRDKQIEYTRLVTTSNHGAHYKPFWELTQAGLRYSCKKLGPGAHERARGPADEPVPPPERLPRKPRGAAGPESQRRGDRHPEQRRPRHAGRGRQKRRLDDLLDHVISVHGIRKYKTHPDAYALGPQATGLDAKQIAFVSSNAWDALAATWYGFRTLWVNRYQQPFEELGTQPTRTGTSLRDTLSFF